MINLKVPETEVVFTADAYDPSRDRYALQNYTRSSLLDSVVRRAIFDVYGGVIRARSPGIGKAAAVGILKHLLRIGLSNVEREAITRTWREWWERHEGRVYERVDLVPLGG